MAAAGDRSFSLSNLKHAGELVCAPTSRGQLYRTDKGHGATLLDRACPRQLSFSDVNEEHKLRQPTCPSRPLSSPRIFYGWIVVAAAFAVMFTGFGCVYTFSAFVDSLQRDFAASRGSVSLVFLARRFSLFRLRDHQQPAAPIGSARAAWRLSE